MGRRKTHGALMKAELGQSIGHLRQAATHAAGGVGATVGPRMQTARGYVAPKAAKVRASAQDGLGSTMAKLAPLAVAAAGTARQAGTVARKAKAENMRGMKKKQAAAKAAKRRSTMGRLLAAGVVAAAVGTMAARRRRSRQEWESYEPLGATETVREDTTVAVTTPDAPIGTGVPERTSTTGRQNGSTSSLSEQMKEKVAGSETSVDNAGSSTRGGAI